MMNTTMNTTTEVKVTKRMRFEEISRLLADHQEIVDFCNHEIELLDKKKASAKGGTSKKREENLALAPTVYSTMLKADKPMTVSEIIKEGGFEMSTQKMTPILRILVEEGKVITDKVKGRTVYLAESPEEE